MNKARLMRLVKLLRKDAANKKGIKFNLTFWAGPSTPDPSPNKAIGDHRWAKAPVDPVPLNCNTSACAMGLAVLSGEFKKEGLYATYADTWNGTVMDPAFKPRGATMTYTGFTAAEELFGLNDDQAQYLFSPVLYRKKFLRGAKGERYVANRIAKFVRDGGLPIDKKTGEHRELGYFVVH